ncbi:uncharacterized protein CC84DRAFT_1222017 [Paraphaeosphaeria sporulosa]|uniref:Uncharacterized protein n=1 Tax=Paraphaeosphaeria sporulosa TaxID=1460663 RepID=A0A177C0Z9_9PLEO|nr:uncharacterized protein CC84DRAFT_1222017 [Paraphaeosphaeria sporulosa]OAG00512.1 hypothetical protein CC84DRAFT_1222017 [Paraphaeosphaeria sporulosa]
MDSPNSRATTPDLSVTKGTSDMHTLPSTPKTPTLATALELTTTAQDLASGSGTPNQDIALSDSTAQAVSNAVLLPRSPVSTAQEPVASSTTTVPCAQMFAFLTRFEQLAYDKIPNANSISETMHDLDQLAESVKTYQSACSRARTYPDPKSFNVQDLLTEASFIQSTAARLAGTTETYIPTLRGWVRDIKTLMRDAGKTLRFAEGVGTSKHTEMYKLLDALGLLQDSARHVLSQSQNHSVLRQWRADSFAILVREAERLPSESSLVARRWFSNRGPKMLEAVPDTEDRPVTGPVEGLQRMPNNMGETDGVEGCP